MPLCCRVSSQLAAGTPAQPPCDRCPYPSGFLTPRILDHFQSLALCWTQPKPKTQPCPSATAVIDNLVKGASGQAIQNMNLLFGLPEETALLQQALFP